jgi:hypothetical protein
VAEEGTSAAIATRPLGEPVARGSLSPPSVTVPWTAEIEWSSLDGATRFRAVAVDGTGARRVLAESAPVPWPPTDAGSLAALREAATALEQGLLAAGWTPLPASGAWYAKRFGWEPFAAERVWHCEIRWTARHLTAGFEAVVTGPDIASATPVAASTAARWRLGREPDPEAADHHARLRRLASALQAAGWQRAGQGDEWYCERFVWHGAEAPPMRREASGRRAVPDDGLSTGSGAGP